MPLFNIPKSKYPTRQILLWLYRELRGNRLQATLNALIGVADVALSLAQVWAIKHAIDVAAGSQTGSIYGAVATMAAITLTDYAINVSGVWVRNILGIRAQNRMQQRLTQRVLLSEWHGKERRHSGDVLNRLETDVSTVVTFITEVLPQTLSTVLMFTGAFFCMFSMDRTLPFILVGIIPIFLLASRLYIGQMRMLTRKVRGDDSDVQAAMQETVQYRMLIKTLEATPDMIGRIEASQSTLRHDVIRRTRFSVYSNVVLNVGFLAGYLTAFLWAALRMAAGTLTYGGMTAFLQLVYKIQSPARSLTKLAPAFVGVFTAAERLMELEEDPLEEQGEPIDMGRCGIRLKDVSFGYDADTEQVIDNLSFDFAPGSVTAILGETGAGKTTLMRLLLALLHPTRGHICLYNESLEAELSPRMRCNFVFVPQGNTLMSGTVRDNLLLGNPAATDEEMKAALNKACADFVMDMPDALDTKCSERGGGLSEGQAQRIAIARALLRNRQIMIFDEATSALDSETEQRLLHNLLQDNQHTMIFVTHRPAVLKYCQNRLHIDRH